MSKKPTTWRAWLPDSALARSGLDQSLADVARQWSLKWLARKTVRPLGALAVSPLSTDGALHWLALDADALVAVSTQATDRIAMLMIGETVPQSIADADRAVLDSLVDVALQDLCRRIAETLGMPPEARWRELGEGAGPKIDRPRGAQLGVDQATPLLHVTFASDVMIALAKRRSPPAPIRERVKPLGTALVGQPVDLSASLGSCSLAIADLAGLAAGDVLVLDRVAHEPLPIAVNGRAGPRGKCTVQQGADSLELKLLEPLAS